MPFADVPPFVDPLEDVPEHLHLDLRLLRCFIAHALVVRSYIVRAAVCIMTQGSRGDMQYCHLLTNIHIQGAVMIREPWDLVQGSESQVFPSLESWHEVDVRDVERHIPMALLSHGGDDGIVGSRLVNEQCQQCRPADLPRSEN